MKKLLGAALALTMGVTCVGSLTACNNGSDGASDKELVEKAISGIKAMYINKIVGETNGDYEVVSQFPITGNDGKLEYYPVTWTVNITEGVTVSEAVNNKIIIDVNEKTATDIEYELTASITYGKATGTYTFTGLKVPGFKINTHAEYASAKDGDALRVSGVVTGFAKKGDGATANTIYIQDEDGGYYIYSLTASDLPEGLAIGKQITVSGKFKFYSGVYELTDCVVENIENGTAVTPTDITDIVKAATDNKDATIVGMQGSLVTIKGATVRDASSENSTYYGFKLGGVSSYVRISASDCPTGKDNQDAIIAAHAANIGKSATITGIITLYSGAFYLVPVNGEAFKDFTESTATPAEKVAEEKASVTLTNKIATKGDITLPTPKTYNDVKFTWKSDNEEIIKIAEDNSTMNVTLPKTPTKVTITLKIKCGEAEDIQTFEISVNSAKEVATGSFKLAMQLPEKKLYFKGTIENNYGATTEKESEAATVVVAKSEEGYTLKVGEKYLELVVSSDEKYVNMALVDTAKGAWAYDYTLDVFTWTIAEGKKAGTYYLGTYMKSDNTIRETIGASLTSYISGTNASKVGESQFVLITEKIVELGEHYLTLQLPEKKLYFKGTIENNYGATTEKESEAATVVVAKSEEGYTLKVGEKYLELVVSSDEKYVNMALVDTAKGAWAYDYTLDVFTWTIAEGKKAGTYYLGTYMKSDNTIRETIGASLTSYISGTNASKVGESQFVLTSEKPVTGTYNLGMQLPEKMLYFKGTIENNYGATTENLSEAATAVIEVVENGYTIKVGEKYLELVVSSDEKYVNMALTDTAKGAWVYDYTLDVFTWTIAEGKKAGTYYLGTYMKSDNTIRETIGASLTSYISGTNAEKIGISQFVLTTVEIAEN